jgi:hypothetical protein
MARTIYGKPVRTLLKDMLTDWGLKPGQVFTASRAIEWFGQHYPKLKPAGIRPKVFADRYADLKHGQRVSSSYFDIRYYPGAGTIHFFARDKTLVDRLNRIVGRRRQWLPPEGARVSDAFWLQFDQAEKLDKEVRTEVRKGCGRWDDPFRELMWNDSEGRSAVAGDKIAVVIDQVLTAHGIALSLDAPPAAQPLLLAA